MCVTQSQSKIPHPTLSLISEPGQLQVALGVKVGQVCEPPPTGAIGALIQPAGIIYPDHIVTFILPIRPRIRQFGEAASNSILLQRLS